MVDRYELAEVKYLPKELDEGILYYSEDFSIAAHKCACGCGGEVYTPIKKGEWALSKNSSGPSLHPSIGNWNFACRSHYWLRRGAVDWSYAWSQERIEAGRKMEEEKRLELYGKPSGWRTTFSRMIDWLKRKLLG